MLNTRINEEGDTKLLSKYENFLYGTPRIGSSVRIIRQTQAQMFLIFILFREDVFSKKDLALINSIKINYNISMLSDKKLDELIKSWKPFNSIASLLLWKSIEEKQFYIK